MRVITWNVNRATATSRLWDTFRRLDPDVALLQELVSMPDDVAAAYAARSVNAVSQGGKKQRFRTAILVKGRLVDRLALTSEHDWVRRKLAHYAGNLVAGSVETRSGRRVNVVCVHSPHWPVDTSGLSPAQIDTIKLKQNPKLWLTEILWSALRSAKLGSGHWIVGGDFNSSETFDREWQDAHGVRYGLRSSGNREIIDRLNALGLWECLRVHSGDIVPTYKHPTGSAVHQMDHLYVSENLLPSLAMCRAASELSIFEGRLSDHLPVIAEFVVGGPAAPGAEAPG